MIYAKDEDVKYRFDKFGGLAWTLDGPIYKLTTNQVIILDILSSALDLRTLSQYFTSSDFDSSIDALKSYGLIVKKNEGSNQEVPDSLFKAISKATKSSMYPVPKPLWAHIQPFTFCNLQCIHCYCNGGTFQPKTKLTFGEWKKIIDQLIEFGIIEIYITGGENFIVDDYFRLTDYVISQGCITGLSTNGTVIHPNTLKYIDSRDLDVVQVSIDGATAETNDHIRGVKGAHRRTLRGIEKLTQVTNVIINMVVNTLNINEVESLIRVGLKHGVKSFKFYPQKCVGRAVNNPNLIVSMDEWLSIPFEKLAQKYKITVDYMKIGSECGSGSSGFAINENGDMFPCIFGTHNPDTRIGNLLYDNLEKLWFNSERLNSFRNFSNLHPCTRCEDRKNIHA